jgi:hypothetical protein
VSAIKQILVVVGALSILVAACADTTNPSPTAPTPAPAPGAPPPTYALTGVISGVTPGGTAPLVDVEVWVGRHHATTDANGYYSLAGVTNSDRIYVTKSGYKQVRQDLAFGGDARLDLQLDLLDVYAFSGVVSEETATGLVPIEGALVTVSSDISMMTDENGFFDIGGLSESDNYDYSVSVTKDAYRPYTKTLTVDEDTRLDIRLARR